MQVEEHIEWLDTMSGAFVAIARDADLRSPVPGCDGWSARDVVGHVGELLRWSSELVATRQLEAMHWSRMGIAAPDDDSVVAWTDAARSQALATFRSCDLSAPVWGWGGDHRGWFWPRRMLFEICVHKTDLERALGRQPALHDELVIEGLDEHLSILPWTAVTDPKVAGLRGTGETIALQAANGPRWRIRFLPGGMAWDRSLAKTNATVTGSLLDLYMHTQGRPNRCELSGDTELHERTLGSLSF